MDFAMETRGKRKKPSSKSSSKKTATKRELISNLEPITIPGGVLTDAMQAVLDKRKLKSPPNSSKYKHQ